MALKDFHLEKDFPISGNKEMRYDHSQERCIYEDVSIEQRVTVPKVIRDDNRYLSENKRKES